MKTLFQAILSISLSGSVIICVVLLARLLLRKAPRQMICLLWLLAGLRLLVPFSIESPFSLQPDQTPGTIQVLPQQTDHMAVAAYIWAGVGACFLIYTFGSYLVLKNRVRDAAAVEAGVYESDRLRTAFILGYFAPKIYLPKGLPEENREFIIAHERAHLARGDNWVKLLGYDVNTTDEAELRACAEKLAEQKPVLQQYVMDEIFATMENEEAWIAAYYAGDCLTMIDNNPDLAFYLPQEQGFNMFIDAMCIPTCAKEKEAAELFINFMCEPEISAANLDYIGYGTPISAAKEYMDEEVVSDPITYPSEQTLANATSFAYLPDEISRLVEQLFMEVRNS